MSIPSNYRDYWNDIEIEKKKPFWIETVCDTKLMRHLREETNLERCFCDAVSFAENIGNLKGRVLDIGAGVAWSSAIISKLRLVQKIVATDFSEHRLRVVAPIVFEQYNGIRDKLEVLIGDFSTLELKKESFDAVIFAQSLYMFSDPAFILGKVNRLLVPDGILIVSCERIIPEYPILSMGFIRRRLGWLRKGRSDLSGNRYFTDSEYHRAIEGAGFDYEFQLVDYPVFPKNSDLKAGNRFGIKRSSI